MDYLAEIQSVLKTKGISKKITLDTEFKSLGLDSLDLMDLVMKAEDKLNVTIDDDKLIHIKTVSDLIDALKQ